MASLWVSKMAQASHDGGGGGVEEEVSWRGGGAAGTAEELAQR
jgi:hypothetical protein